MISSKSQFRSTKRRGCVLLLLVCALPVLAGCGSSSAPPKPRQGLVTAANRGGEAGTAAAGRGGQAGAAASIAAITPAAVVKARTPRGAGPDADAGVSSISSKPVDPCSLVHTAELRAIVHSSVTSVTEAPLGPTCVYDVSRSKGEITIAIASGRLSAMIRSMSTPKRVTVGHRVGYCGTAGANALVVALSRVSVLRVTAPCAVALPVAARALSRL